MLFGRKRFATDLIRTIWLLFCEGHCVAQLPKAVSASPQSSRQRDVLGVVIYGHGVRYSAARQREVIGVEVRPRKWLEIRKRHLLSDQVMHTVVHGRCFAIHWLFLVCDTSRSARENKSLVTTFVKSVRRRGGEIYEVGSGRCTSSRNARSDMISDAHEAIAALVRGRLPRTLNQLGHPRRNWTKRQQQIVWTEWFNRKHATNEDAAAAASKRLCFNVTSNQMWQTVRAMRRERGSSNATGASGRPWKHQRQGRLRRWAS